MAGDDGWGCAVRRRSIYLIGRSQHHGCAFASGIGNLLVLYGLLGCLDRYGSIADPVVSRMWCALASSTEPVSTSQQSHLNSSLHYGHPVSHRTEISCRIR